MSRESAAAAVADVSSHVLGIDLARAWRRPPSVASINTIAITTSFFYTLGGLIVLVITLAFHPPVNEPCFVGIGYMALGIGSTCFLLRSRLPRWFYFLAVLWGTFLITTLVLQSHDSLTALVVSMLYLFVVMDASFFFSIQLTLVQYVLMLAAALWSLTRADVAVTAMVMLLVCATAILLVVMWLARKIDDVEYDALTNLLNRRGIDRRLEEAMPKALADKTQLYAAIIDLDRFKRVNDELGHLAGDQLLTNCARAWSQLLPGNCRLGRYGGDEFLLVASAPAIDGITELAERLRKITPPGSTASVGIAQWLPEESASMLISRADMALYQAKSTGRNRVVVYDDASHARHEMEAAIVKSEFRVWYQPIVDLETREIIAYEALTRWQHPQRGLLLPGEFILQAERSGAIHALGMWLIETVVEHLAKGLTGSSSIQLNASVQELRRTDYAAGIVTLLDQYQLSGNALVVEVTESVFSEFDAQIPRTLDRLRERGIRIAIDDFGSGYSSLRRIQNLPIDSIKLDGSLIQSIDARRDNTPILEALVTMGKGLGVSMVAEWVETEEQVAMLRRLGYRYGQGYLFGKAAPLEAA